MIQAELTIKQAKGYSTQFLGNCIPKNALYFRQGNYVAYCDDFQQFARQKVVDVHVMNLKGNGHFKTVAILRTNPIAQIFAEEVKARGISALKCENVLCIKRAGEVPEMRTPKLQQVRMKPDSSGTITDCNLEKETGSFVATAIMRDYGTGRRGDPLLGTYYQKRVQERREKKIYI